MSKVAKQVLIWRDSLWTCQRMYLPKRSDVCSFEETNRAQNIWEGISDCQLKTVCLAEEGDFQA